MSSVKIGIGTAQFGMDYGVSNSFPRPSPEEIRQILAFAEENGICHLDTSPSYGDSEERLGSALPLNHHFKISTKTPVSEKEPVEETLYRSLDRLRQQSVYALLVHRPEHLLLPGGDQLIETLLALKQKGLIRKIGVSVYNQEMIDKILALFTPDMIQLPLSPFDQRLLQSGSLKKLKRKNIELQARSIFLQGLLLMEPAQIPPYLNRVRPEIREYHRFLKSREITPLEGSVSFASNVKEIDSFVCGICSLQQLQEIMAAATQPELAVEEFAKIAMTDESILNPSLWETS